MSIACTFPGKHGDLLWALPTVRAISRTYDVPVDLLVSPYVEGLLPLLRQQPYIRYAQALPSWQVQETAPMSPRTPPDTIHAEKVFHLGYEGWPLSPLPMQTLDTAAKQTRIEPGSWSIEEPWITVPERPDFIDPSVLAIGFTDEWFELKLGHYYLLESHGFNPFPLYAEGSRWATEGAFEPFDSSDWLRAALVIKHAGAFLGCCSALHVLSAALGQQTVVMEPNEHRWHPIFWPYGKSGHPRVRCVLGGDGKPTFDARHTRDLIEEMLQSA